MPLTHDQLERYEGNEDLAADPDEHRFHIPEGHFWEDVRRKTTVIGAAPNQGSGAVEMARSRASSGFASTIVPSFPWRPTVAVGAGIGRRIIPRREEKNTCGHVV